MSSLESGQTLHVVLKPSKALDSLRVALTLGQMPCSVPWAHLDYSVSTTKRGVPMAVTWTSGESFEAVGAFKSGGVITALTGGAVPGWLADLLSILKVDIRAVVDFEPGSTMVLDNYILPDPRPPGIDQSLIPIRDMTKDHAALDAAVTYAINAGFSITVTLDLIIPISWTWNPLDVKLLEVNDKLAIARATVEINRALAKSGEAATYKRIQVPQLTLHGAEAKAWIDACLAASDVSVPEPPYAEPEYTDNQPYRPVPCIVEATCEGDVPFFRLCNLSG